MKEPNKVKDTAPVFTIKINDVSIQSAIGQEWSIEVTPVGFKIDPLKVSRGKQNTFLLQTPWDTKNPSTVSIEVKAIERDKIGDTFGPETFEIAVDKSLPIASGSRKGQKNHYNYC